MDFFRMHKCTPYCEKFLKPSKIHSDCLENLENQNPSSKYSEQFKNLKPNLYNTTQRTYESSTT